MLECCIAPGSLRSCQRWTITGTVTQSRDRSIGTQRTYSQTRAFRSFLCGVPGILIRKLNTSAHDDETPRGYRYATLQHPPSECTHPLTGLQHSVPSVTLTVRLLRKRLHELRSERVGSASTDYRRYCCILTAIVAELPSIYQVSSHAL